MTLLDLLLKAAGLPADTLTALITAGGNAAPDLKPLADEWIARLGEAVSSDNLALLAAALPAELADIVHGNLSPRRHPSDAA